MVKLLATRNGQTVEVKAIARIMDEGDMDGHRPQDDLDQRWRRLTDAGYVVTIGNVTGG